MEIQKRERILCVDDEEQVMVSLALHLRRRYDVQMATSGEAGLTLISSQPPFAAVISDMQMPGMNGAAFLAQVRKLSPDTVRILLTGHADLDSAIAAINDGQIFRFLTKPCLPSQLMSTVEAAVQLHRLTLAERVLLEQTLHGVVRLLTDVLALSNPAAHGRAIRIKQLVTDLANRLAMRERWQVEVAAMLSQLGFITLPAETMEKVFLGTPLLEKEQQMVARVPSVTEQLLAHIPRLESVRAILATYSGAFDWAHPPESPAGEAALIARGAQLLKVSLDFDELTSRGVPLANALDTLRGRGDRYDPAVLDALDSLHGGSTVRDEVRELPLGLLRAGMICAEDLRMSSGTLLVARGYEITAGFLERIRNFGRGTVKEPVRVIVPA